MPAPRAWDVVIGRMSSSLVHAAWRKDSLVSQPLGMRERPITSLDPFVFQVSAAGKNLGCCTQAAIVALDRRSKRKS